MNDHLSVALTKCFYCGESNQILIARRFGRNKFVEEANGKVLNMDPCPKCEEYMRQGIIIITIDSSKSDPGWNKQRMPNPYRTGGFFVVTEDAVSQAILDPAIANWCLESRWLFVEHQWAEQAGLFELAKEKFDDNREIHP